MPALKPYILILIFLACTSKKSTETVIFNTYLEKTFHQKIPSKTQYYLIVPKFGCSGCIYKSLLLLNDSLNKIDLKKFTIISSIPEIIPKNLIDNTSFLYDKQGVIDKINLNISNVTFIVTSNENVEYIYNSELEHENILLKMYKNHALGKVE